MIKSRAHEGFEKDLDWKNRDGDPFNGARTGCLPGKPVCGEKRRLSFIQKTPGGIAKTCSSWNKKKERRVKDEKIFVMKKGNVLNGSSKFGASTGHRRKTPGTGVGPCRKIKSRSGRRIGASKMRKVFQKLKVQLVAIKGPQTGGPGNGKKGMTETKHRWVLKSACGMAAV